jgi:16S rRNA (adenine1518-N6/adenine1519-N6)-dimethyltransferase
VERDARCLPALQEIAAAFPGRLSIVSADALVLQDCAALAAHGGGSGPVRIAANLPYNIGTALLVKWLTGPVWPPFWSSATLMFQREVAERIVARPRCASYGRLSVLSQWRTRARILFHVSARAFTPQPKVNSCLVRIEPLADPIAAANLADLEAVTAAAFGQKRKMLRQSLKRLSPRAEDLLATSGIPSTARAEELSVQDFAALARAYAGLH